MIGQAKLLDKLNGLINEDKLPRFIIIVGERGSQSDEIAPFIAGVMSANCVRLNDVKVDTIRRMIDEAYSFSEITIYNIADADNMSVNAKNAMLKVCEEPPNNAYFVMSLESLDNTLETIKSRATVFYMDKYSKSELMQYCDKRCKDKNQEYKDMIVSFSDTPGDIDILSESGDKFYEYVDRFVEDAIRLPGTEALNLTSEVSVKDGDGKFDAIMFFKIFQNICLRKAEEYSDSQIIAKYCWSVIRAGECMRDIKRVRGINKQMLLDEFVLRLRKIWK